MIIYYSIIVCVYVNSLDNIKCVPITLNHRTSRHKCQSTIPSWSELDTVSFYWSSALVYCVLACVTFAKSKHIMFYCVPKYNSCVLTSYEVLQHYRRMRVAGR